MSTSYANVLGIGSTGVVSFQNGVYSSNSISSHALLCGNSSGGVSMISPSTSGYPLVSAGASSDLVFASSPLSITVGGTGDSTVRFVPAASKWAGWDSNKNLRANAFVEGFQTIATANSITNLLVDSPQLTYFTGTTTQQVNLPDTAGCLLGQKFEIVNLSSGNITLNDNDGAELQVCVQGSHCILTVISTSTSPYYELLYITDSSGATVSSVSFSDPGGIFSVSGSPITNSGTIALSVTGTSGGIPYFSDGTTLSSSAALTADQLVVGKGAGNAPAVLSAGSQYQSLVMGSSAPAYGAVPLNQSAATSGTLPYNRGGTGLNSNTAYKLIAGGNSDNSALQQLASVGTSGQYLRSNGSSNLPTWQDWKENVVAALTGATNAVANTTYVVGTDNTGASTTLPSSPALGDMIKIIDLAGDYVVNAGTGKKIRIGTAQTSSTGSVTSLQVGNILQLLYDNTSSQWVAVASLEDFLSLN